VFIRGKKKTARKKHPCKTSVAKLAHTQARAIMGDGTSHPKTTHANATLTNRSLTVAAQNPPPAAPQLRSSVPIRVHPWQKNRLEKTSLQNIRGNTRPHAGKSDYGRWDQPH